VGRFLVSLLLPVLLLARPSGELHADPSDPGGSAATVLDTLEVIGRRPEPVELLSTFATVHYVEESTQGIATVADVIEEGVGVHVRRYGGVGAYSAASIRASSPGQVEIYLDGVPLKSGQWGVVNLADLPLDNLERIEVYRGGAPVEFGTPGIGGLVNLVTRSTGEGRFVGSVSAASYDTWKIDLLKSGAVGALDYLVSGHHLQSRGDYEYLDRHGTPQNSDDDEVVTRSNNAFRQSDVLVRIALPALSGWRVELTDDYFRKRSGIPGIESVQTERVRYEIRRNLARVRVESPLLFGNSIELSTGAFHQERRDLFHNPDDEVGFHRSDTDNTSRSFGGNALGRFYWRAARQVVSVFGEARWERYVPKDANPAIGTGFTRRRDTRSLSAEDKLLLLGGRLEFVASYRFQEAIDNFSGPEPIGGPPVAREDSHRLTSHGPGFGARWRLHPRFVVKANHTRYGRFPTMLELFGASGYVVGNPDLTLERGVSTDAGVTVYSGDGSGFLEAAFYWAEREDLVVFLQNSQRTVKARNLESARVEGLELSGRREWANGIELSAGYTLQNARNTGPSPIYRGKRLPYEPKHDLFVRTSLERGRLDLWHEYHYESEAYRDRANLPENLSPGKHIHDIGARR